MRRYSSGLALAVLLIWAGSAIPSHSQAPGYIRVTFAKAAMMVGAGGGRGVLTYRGRDYPFKVFGLSIGVATGASVMRLTGNVSKLDNLKDFPGVYDAAGIGGALVGGFGGVQLRNRKGVTITLQGPEVGLELGANRSGIKISLL